jgi:hypothetical protein
MDIHWLSSLWAKNAERKPPASGGDSPAFEKNRHEFMFDSLMDVPPERIDRRITRAFE